MKKRRQTGMKHVFNGMFRIISMAHTLQVIFSCAQNSGLDTLDKERFHVLSPNQIVRDEGPATQTQSSKSSLQVQDKGASEQFSINRSEFDFGPEDENISKIRKRKRVKRSEENVSKLDKNDFYGEEYEEQPQKDLHTNEDEEIDDNRYDVEEIEEESEIDGESVKSDTKENTYEIKSSHGTDNFDSSNFGNAAFNHNKHFKDKHDNKEIENAGKESDEKAKARKSKSSRKKNVLDSMDLDSLKKLLATLRKRDSFESLFSNLVPKDDENKYSKSNENLHSKPMSEEMLDTGENDVVKENENIAIKDSPNRMRTNKRNKAKIKRCVNDFDCPRPCLGRPSMLKNQDCNVCSIFAQKCMDAKEIIGIDDPGMAGRSQEKCRTKWDCDFGHFCKGNGIKRHNGNHNIETDEFLGVCKTDPDYVAEQGLKCFRDHTLCRKGLYCGEMRKKGLFKGQYVCKKQHDLGQKCYYDHHCKEGLQCLPEIYNELGKPPRDIPNKKHVSKFCGKADAKPDKECHPHQNHCTGEHVCTKVGIKRNPLDGKDGSTLRSRRRNVGQRRIPRFRRTRSKRQTKRRNRSSFRNEGRQRSRRSLKSLTLQTIKEGIWKCRLEDLNSLIGCRDNRGCPCGEYCDRKNRRCKRASCKKEAKGGLECSAKYGFPISKDAFVCKGVCEPPQIKKKMAFPKRQLGDSRRFGI